MSDHAWVQENIASYLAGGLEPSERERLEQHIAACESCAALLEEARGLDQTLQSLFASVRPAAALEDRMIRSLRTAPRRYRIGRLVTAIAAVLLVGAIGAGATTFIMRGRVPFPGQWEVALGSAKDFQNRSADDLGKAQALAQRFTEPPAKTKSTSATQKRLNGALLNSPRSIRLLGPPPHKHFAASKITMTFW